jgi:hypothetical protein
MAILPQSSSIQALVQRLSPQKRSPLLRSEFITAKQDELEAEEGTD